MRVASKEAPRVTIELLRAHVFAAVEQRAHAVQDFDVRSSFLCRRSLRSSDHADELAPESRISAERCSRNVVSEARRPANRTIALAAKRRTKCGWVWSACIHRSRRVLQTPPKILRFHYLKSPCWREAGPYVNQVRVGPDPSLGLTRDARRHFDLDPHARIGEPCGNHHSGGAHLAKVPAQRGPARRKVGGVGRT